MVKEELTSDPLRTSGSAYLFWSNALDFYTFGIAYYGTPRKKHDGREIDFDDFQLLKRQVVEGIKC